MGKRKEAKGVLQQFAKPTVSRVSCKCPHPLIAHYSGTKWCRKCERAVVVREVVIRPPLTTTAPAQKARLDTYQRKRYKRCD